MIFGWFRKPTRPERSDIKVGDLVMVVRWPCCGRGLGVIFTVKEIELPHGRTNATRCKECGKTTAFLDDIGICEYIRVPLSWCKRIPPLEQTDEEGRDERLDEKTPALSQFGEGQPQPSRHIPLTQPPSLLSVLFRQSHLVLAHRS